MRPISLEMSAFGPFPETETIAFDQLGHNPLFLINGPTGSGKTTILDAICFALYGKSTGDEREGPQMRCDQADLNTLTKVTFVFELGGKTYRILRIPEQQRPKSRGDGFTDQKAQAELYEISENGEEKLLVSSKVTEATAEIEALTGLNADQFRQVMVLPQGKFRQLLMAESKEREQIFSNLFQTQIYKKLEEHLKTKSAAIKRQVEKLHEQQHGVLGTIDVESIKALAEQLEALKPEVEKAEKQKQSSDKKYLDSFNQLQAAQNILKQFTSLEQTQKKYASLVAQKSEIENKRNKKEKAEQANNLLPQKKDLERCRIDLKTAVDKQNQARKAEQNSRELLQIAERELKRIEELNRINDQLNQELTRLKGYAERSRKLIEFQKQLKQAQKTESEITTKVIAVTEKKNELVRQKEDTESKIQQLQLHLSNLPQVQQKMTELNDQLSYHKDLVDITIKLNHTQDQLKKAEEEKGSLQASLDTSVQSLKFLEMRWHQGQASLLAKELKQGIPCPVCGSKEHPAPASGDEAIPTENELKTARAGNDRIQSQLTEKRETCVALESTLKNLQLETQKTRQKQGVYLKVPKEQIEELYRDTEIALQQMQKEQKQWKDFSQVLDQLKKSEQKIHTELEELRTAQSARKTQLATAEANLKNAKQELPEEFRFPGALEKAIQTKQKEIENTQSQINTIRKKYETCLGTWKTESAFLQASNEVHQTAVKALEKADIQWKSELEKSPFATETEFNQSVLTKEALATLTEEINQYEIQLNQVKGAMEQQESAVKNLDKPDIQLFEQELHKALSLKKEAENQWQTLDKRFSQLESARKKLHHLQSDQEKFEQQYALVGTLSDVANGQTGNKISLQRFVLSVLLDDVLVESSQRLSLMSKGRYRLLRKEDRTKGNKASGLDLEVEDGYSGKVRPVSTLSGGESFMAALSLALGLSDVVQAYAGGIRLDTLFIDEGFGSLDPESLDLAIRTLTDLQSSGRMIGIISHVSDLKEQIDYRLDVIADRKGSRVKLVTP